MACTGWWRRRGLGYFVRVTDVPCAVDVCQLCSSAPNTRCSYCSSGSLFIRSRLLLCSFDFIVLQGKLALKTNPQPLSLNCRWLLLAPAATLVLDYFHMGLWWDVVSMYRFLHPETHTLYYLQRTISPNLLDSPHRLPISQHYNYDKRLTSEANYTLVAPLLLLLPPVLPKCTINVCL